MRTHTHKGWEYLIKTYHRNDTTVQDRQAKLNELGQEGWELVNTIRCDDGLYVNYFKRPLP